MSPLWRIAVLIWREERAALSRGLLLSVIVLLAGAALLGLSGWFVTAAGAAGVAGIGIAFDVFRPSAGVRMLALGRTAARYGERILTHDATLRALARLRVKVLDGLAAQPAETLARLRSPAMLNRVTADVDALDGVAIRLVFPILAGGITLLAAGACWHGSSIPVIALWVVGTLTTGAILAMVIEGRRAIAPAEDAEAARQTLRSAAVEHLRARTILTFAGSLPDERGHVLCHDAAARAAERRLARLDRRAASLASGSAILAAGGALPSARSWHCKARSPRPQRPSRSSPPSRSPRRSPRFIAASPRSGACAARQPGLPRRFRHGSPTPGTGPAAPPAPGLSLHAVTVAAPGSATALIQPVDLHVAPGRDGRPHRAVGPWQIHPASCHCRSVATAVGPHHARWQRPRGPARNCSARPVGRPATGEPPRLGNDPQQPAARGARGRGRGHDAPSDRPRPLAPSRRAAGST
jgi:ATP-binding cassette subfamily C protein CydC